MSEYYWEGGDYPTRKDMIKAAINFDCPICSSKMVMRWRRSDMQPFFSCSRFHEDGCKGARNWTGVVGYTDKIWEDTLQNEGKIDPERLHDKAPAKREGNADFWQKKFEEERAFVMQQLHDIKNDLVSQRRRIETLEESQPNNKPKKERRSLATNRGHEDDIPF